MTIFPSSTELAAAATSYAAAGWPVLPLKPREKVPATKHGLHDASDDPNLVEAWWARWPDANIGLRTGIAFDVLDLDGPASLTSLAQTAPAYRHDGPVSSTGKGYHLLFGVTGSRNGAGLKPGIDWRGDGGYIVAPPSIHPSGSIYTWIRPITLALPDAPTWLIDMLRYRSEPKSDQKVSPTVSQALGMLSLSEELGKLGVQLRNVGSRLVGRCPFGMHRDSEPSLNVYPNDTFYCFGCDSWGDALNVIAFARDGRLR